MNASLQNAYSRSVLIETGVSEASGVVIESGLVLTNFHCLSNDNSVNVDGKDASIVFVSPQDDLCLLSAETLEVDRVSFGQADITEQVFYVGNPGGLRDAVVFGRVIAYDEDSMFCDCPVQCGASGSGVYNLKGQMVGMAEAIRQPSRDDDHFGSAFLMCIKPDAIRNFLHKALKHAQALAYLEADKSEA